MIPGNVDFLGRMYAFGAMLSFTIAHAAVIQLRRKPPPIEDCRTACGRTSIGGVELAGVRRRRRASGPGSRGSSWSSRTRRRATRASPGSRPASSSTRSTGAGSAMPLRETVRAPSLRAGGGARVPDDPRADRARAASRDEAVDVACRLAAERGATIVALRVIVVPLDLPLDAELPERGGGGGPPARRGARRRRRPTACA